MVKQIGTGRAFSPKNHLGSIYSNITYKIEGVIVGGNSDNEIKEK